MTIGSLFSGIGGLELGLEWAGLGTTIWQVEINDYARKILKKWWPDAKRYRDIRDVGKHNLEPVDLICGGWPCQPFSVAGKQKGKEDDRYLWPEMARIIEELQPLIVIGENVPGITKMGLDETLSDMESFGYTTATVNIPACAVDAPHIRQRIFFLAYSGYRDRGLSHESRDGLNCKWESAEETNQIKRSGERCKDVADTKKQRLEGANTKRKICTNGQPMQCSQNTTITDKINDDRWRHGTSEIQQQKPTGIQECKYWLPEPDVGRVALRIPNRVDRLKCLGNAVVPQVSQAIGEIIKEFIENANQKG